MTEQIRKNVFETNSSSSHSLTMSKGDIAPQPFADEILRKGSITLSKNEYGWEYYRYYDPIGKAQYLMTQLFEGDTPSGSPSSTAREMREENERFDMLCRVIEEHTGVSVYVEPNSSGYIDHQSEGRGLEVFESEATLKKFLFSPESYIQTGNDNSSAGQIIHTDRGVEHYYQAYYREPKKSHVTVALRSTDHWGFSDLVTEKGGVLSDKKNQELLAEVRKTGTVVKADFDYKAPYAPFEYGEPSGDTMAKLARYEWFFSKDLQITQKHIKIGYRDESGYRNETLFVSVPAALAEQLAALKPPRKRKPAAAKADKTAEA